MSQPQTMLCIGNGAKWARAFRQRIPAEVRVLAVTSSHRARRLFDCTPDITMVVITGGCDVSKLVALVANIRPRFKGLMIAGHRDKNVNRALMDAGCNDMEADRSELPILVKKLLLGARDSRSHQRRT